MILSDLSAFRIAAKFRFAEGDERQKTVVMHTQMFLLSLRLRLLRLLLFCFQSFYRHVVTTDRCRLVDKGNECAWMMIGSNTATLSICLPGTYSAAQTVGGRLPGSLRAVVVPIGSYGRVYIHFIYTGRCVVLRVSRHTSCVSNNTSRTQLLDQSAKHLAYSFAKPRRRG